MEDIHPTINPVRSQQNHVITELCELIRQEKVVLWVGSGFSKYAGYPTGTELTSIILSQTGKSLQTISNSDSISLNEAADIFINNKGRVELNSLLINEFGKKPSRCDIHESLALINRVKYIITTNYDQLFEKAYGEKIQVVSRDKDLPDSAENPDNAILLKIHGDIAQPDSIIITSEDYGKFRSDRIVWSDIRSLLSKYAVVFIGYSLNDPHVKTMLDDIDTRLQEKRHPWFFISKSIDESTRLDLATYNFHFIEMDAVDAIKDIVRNTIQFAYLDSLRNPALFPKSAQIFEKKGLRADRSFNGDIMSRASLIPTHPIKQRDIQITITSKKGPVTPQMLALQKHATGESFEEVIVTEAECDISIRGGEMNGIFMFDPSIKNYPQFSVKHEPDIDTIDLQLQGTSTRISNLNMKIFNSNAIVKFEIEDPIFILKFTFRKGQRAWSFDVSLRRAVRDIERSRFIYGFFDRWIHGETIELLDERFTLPFIIPSPPPSEIPQNFPDVHKIHQFYTDLSEIQRNLKVRISIPDEITSEDLKNIRNLASFISGEKLKLARFRTSVKIYSEQPLRLVEGEIIPFEGPTLVGKWEYHIFGKIYEVPYRVEGSDFLFDDVETVQKLIDQGLNEFDAAIKSKTEDLFAVYDPQKN